MNKISIVNRSGNKEGFRSFRTLQFVKEFIKPGDILERALFHLKILKQFLEFPAHWYIKW